MAKENYQFSDLFDADLNQMALGKKHREKITVGSLVDLERRFPNMMFNR